MLKDIHRVIVGDRDYNLPGLVTRLTEVEAKLEQLVEARNRLLWMVIGLSGAISFLGPTTLGLSLYIWRIFHG